MAATVQQTGTLLETLRQGLAHCQAEITGEAGRKVAAIDDATGVLPDLIRQVLKVVAEALRSLYGLTLSAEHFVIQADAAFGVVEVALDSVKPITSGELFSGFPQALNLPPDGFDAVDNGLRQFGGALDIVGDGISDVYSFLPRPEDLRGIATEISGLLGTVVAPEAEGPGPLATLLAEIGVELAAN